MKKRYFSRKIKRRAKNNLKRSTGRKRILSKRFGAVLHASMIMENRAMNTSGNITEKKEII